MTAAHAKGRALFFILFTISGFSGLIYESIWSHYLKLFLGHAAYAQTLVLAIFMGGMALGSALTARYSVRIRSLLLGYAIAEGAIGVFGLVFHAVSIAVTTWAFDALLPGIESAAAAQAAKWTIGALLIFPQSVLLGTTFPLMSGAVIRRFPERSGETLSMLYFTNSLGAAVGVLVSGFVLIGAVGLPGTMLTAGILNVLLALIVWGISKSEPSVQPAAPATATVATTPSASIPLLRLMLIGAAMTGVAAFFYEIAWIRMLSLVLGSSTHSFELMLSAFILGIALGGLWVRKRIDSLPDAAGFLARILVIMALVALVSLPLYNSTFDMMATVVQMFAPLPAGYAGTQLAAHSIAMLMMIPTTFFCGMTLPIMTNVLIRSGGGERAIGAIYAWNTAGAIVGVIVAVHVLMPLIGVRGVVIAGATLHLLLAVAISSYGTSARTAFARPSVYAAAGGIAIAVATFFFHFDSLKVTSGVFRHGAARHDPRTQVIFLRDGKTATVSLVDMEDGLISIATNGKPDAAIRMRGVSGVRDEITMVLAAALPLSLHPHPAKVANIGIGSGLTTHALLASDVVEQVDTVEIEPLMAEAARKGFMPRVERTFTDPRSHLHFEDAKTFFALQKTKYDVIVSEPSNPWVSGVSTLFSREFYRQINRYLEDDGLLVQWIQTYEADMDIVYSVIKALAPEFADFAIYNADNTNLLIVASRNGVLPKPGAGVFASSALRAELLRVGISDVQNIQSRYLGSKALLMPLLQANSVPANSDYFPFVDLNAPRARILKRSAIEYSRLQILPIPFFELIEGAADPRAITKASPGPTSDRDTLIAHAVEIRNGIEQSAYGSLPPETSRALLTLASSKEECAKPGVRTAWLDSAYVVAAQVNTALSAAELADIWTRIAATACAAELTAKERDLFELIRAVAARDMPRIAERGLAVLSSGYPLPGRSNVWVLIATSASLVATGNAAQASALLANVAGNTPAIPSEILAATWIAALAAQRGHGQE
jgi:spermidine synthase